MTRPVDLRSDTVTRPTAAMRRAMHDAEVGDDVLGDDPTVRLLEEEAAAIVGHEAALFVPSGTMGNQIAILLHARRGEDVIVEATSHIAVYELGGLAAWSGAMLRAIAAESGLPTVAQLEAAWRGGPFYDDARTSMLALENTHMFAGGVAHPRTSVAPVLAFARARSLPVHLDGARLFNAATALGVPASAVAAGFDSVMFCFSKGLGAPVGSCLAGSQSLIAEARRFRKRLGGGMRQAGILAAGALHALRNHVDRLADDHARARRLADGIAEIPTLEVVPNPPQSNIVMVRPREGTAEALRADLERRGLLAFTEGDRVRLVTHLDCTDDDIDRAIAMLRDAAVS